MITLGTLETKLSFALGTSETNLMTDEKRIDAINKAIEVVLTQYPIPQYVVSSNLAFTSGIAELPENCLMPLKLNDPTQASVVYSRVNWDDFESNISYTYTIAWDAGLDAEHIAIYPTTATTLQFWYVQNFTQLETDTDTIRLNIWWADAIAAKAAEFLLLDTASFNRAEAKRNVADDLIAKAWQIERARITGVQDQRLRSIYSKYSLLQQTDASITWN